MREPIGIHNNMYSMQMNRYMKYGERDIVMPELPPDFVSAIHCRMIYRSLVSPFSDLELNSSDSDDSDDHEYF